MTTIYRQDLEVVYTSPECDRRIEEFKKLPLSELYSKLAQATRSLKRLRRIAGDLRAVDRNTAYYAICEVLTMEYYREENLEKAILEPRLLIDEEFPSRKQLYCGKTEQGDPYSIEVSNCEKPNVLDKEVTLYREKEHPMTLYVDWPEIPETKVLRFIEWLELP